MLTEQDLSYQISTGHNVSHLIEEDVKSVDTPVFEFKTTMIQVELAFRLENNIQLISDVDWTSFMDSVFEINHGVDFINKVHNKVIKVNILNYRIDNYDCIIGNEWRKAPWISEWREMLEKEN